MSITAQELYDQMLHENDEATRTEMMIEFAKIKVQEALSRAAEDVYVTTERDSYRNITSATINKDSILNAYPLELIK